MDQVAAMFGRFGVSAELYDIALLLDVANDFTAHEECFFRGQLDRRWELLPSLFRHAKRRALTDAQRYELESDLSWEFHARAIQLSSQPLTDWDVPFFMQHHGVPTRLLDWTDKLGIALYFALREPAIGTTPCIWMLNPYRLNEHPDSWEARDLVAPRYLGSSMDYDEPWDYGDFFSGAGVIPWKYAVALFPDHRSTRQHAQSGFFTIHGQSTKGVEAQLPAALAKVEIPAKHIKPLKAMLDEMGINESLIFPDLDGLAADLRRKYRIA